MEQAMKRIYDVAAKAVQRRDEIEMRSIDRLLSPLARKRVLSAMNATAIRRMRVGGFRAILCPVDFSGQSRVALGYAASVAKRSGGRLTVLYVNDPLLIAAAGIALHDRSLAKRSLDELCRFVTSVVPGTLVQPARVDVRVASGQPADEIAKAARRDECDLIVMGTHGLTGPTKLLIGSTTSGVLRQAAVPVLAVPMGPPARRRLAGPDPSWPGKNIVGAIELNGHAERDARAAAAVAGWFGSRLLLVHVVDAMKAASWLRKRIATADRTRIARARSRLATIARRLGRAASVDVRIVFGQTAGELASLAATEDPGLIVTTLRAASDLFGARRGSISYAVLAQVTTPVLALPG
jgi:universal stress protein A